MSKPVQIQLSVVELQTLLQELSGWDKVTTIVIHCGCVFEYKGRFPSGSNAEGYYNFGAGETGFQGHLRLENIACVRFQDRPHRGRASCAFVFETEEGEAVFKVFLGRDEQGEIIEAQRQRFDEMRHRTESSEHAE